MKILAIETSCDDTSIALLEVIADKTKNYLVDFKVKVLADFISSQTKIHAPFGGVVPHLATRAHYRNLPILLEKVLAEVEAKKIDLTAVTVGPGLEPSLWAGIKIGRVLAMALKKPIVGVNHLEGHIAANFISGNQKSKILKHKQRRLSDTQKITSIFPAICLIVSGGHTQLVLIKNIGKYKTIGQTRDDAAGEAFDKVAKMFGLGYPGGPKIATQARKGNVNAFELPRPMIDAPDYDFSFSGLKTAVLYLVRDLIKQRCFTNHLSKGETYLALLKKNAPPVCLTKKEINDLCASFQQAVIDVLIHKTIKAALNFKAKTIMLAGGVAANKELRKQIKIAIVRNIPGTIFIAPEARYCTDNAVMIGLAGYWKYKRLREDKIEKVIAKANLNL